MLIITKQRRELKEGRGVSIKARFCWLLHHWRLCAFWTM